MSLNRPTVKVEIAFATDPDSSNPAWEDVSRYVMGFSVRRGRSYELDTIQASTLTLRLDAGDRRFDPSYSFSPYAPNVLPMRKIRVSATWSSTTYYLFTGFVERWPITWDAPKWGSVTVTAVDAFAALQQATISGTFAQASTGDRIAAVLTAATWAESSPAAGYWTLGTSALGTTTMLSYGTPTTVIAAGRTAVAEAVIEVTANTSALAHIQEVVAAERGVFFIDGQGRAVFQDRHDRYGATSIVTFTDGPTSATRLPYQDLHPDFDVDRIVNEVTVTRDGGVAQTASDGRSRTIYFRRSLSLTPPLLTDAEALDQALFEVTLRKDAALRFDQITVRPEGNMGTWPYALGLELGDKVTVERTPGSFDAITAETISQQCFVEAVEHAASPAMWETRFQLSPADRYDQFFALGSAVLADSASATLAY